MLQWFRTTIYSSVTSSPEVRNAYLQSGPKK